MRIILKILISFVVLCLTSCAFVKQEPKLPKVKDVTNTKIERLTEEDLEPPIDAVTLMLTDNIYRYQLVNINSELTIICNVNQRDAVHNISNSLVHEADEFVSYEIVTLADDYVTGVTSGSELAYICIGGEDSVLYKNINYGGWSENEFYTNEQYLNFCIPIDNVISVEEDVDTLRYTIEAEVYQKGDTDLDRYIQWVLSDFSDDLTYSFTIRAIMSSMTNDIIFMDIDVDVTSSGTYNSYEAVVDTMHISIDNVKYNNVDTVILPDYVYSSISHDIEEFYENEYVDESEVFEDAEPIEGEVYEDD